VSGGSADPFERHEFDVLVRDLDPQGHVANHVYVAYFSEARARFMRALDRDGAGLLPSVVAEMRCRYVSPLLPFERFTVAVRVAAVGRTSLRFAYRVLAGDRLVADGDSTEVLIDPATKRPREIPQATRERLAAVVGDRDETDLPANGAGERTRHDGIAPRP
jgi:acyl-CoA thioester hydrolase